MSSMIHETGDTPETRRTELLSYLFFVGLIATTFVL